MAKFIAHRGNFQGKNPDRENTIEYIKRALDAGYWVEVDLQTKDEHLYFGHDDPQEIVDYDLVMDPRVINHAKDWLALTQLRIMGAHYFWHNSDQLTLTSQNYAWCYPGIHHHDVNSIWLDFGEHPLPKSYKSIFGICCDNFKDYT